MKANRWQRTGFGIGGLLALAVLFLGVVMLSNLALHGVRLDLTQNRLYTLSPGTKQVLGELKEPINLYFYFSRDAAAKQSPLIMPYAARVREFLEEVTARAGGKIRLQVVDPQPFSEDEDRAAEAGLQPLQVGDGSGGTVYFGLAGTNSTDGRSVIPGFTPDREEFLEYDVAKLIQELANPQKPVIGLMSSLPMQGQFNPMTGQMGETWPILSQLEQLFTVRSLTTDLDHIDKDVDVLMIVHPKNFPPKTRTVPPKRGCSRCKWATARVDRSTSASPAPTRPTAARSFRDSHPTARSSLSTTSPSSFKSSPAPKSP